MTVQLIALSIFTLAGTIFPGYADAASGALAGTGTVTEENETAATNELLLQEALQPYAIPAQSIAIPAMQRRSWQTVSERLIKHLYDTRAACRNDLRRANRDARLNVLLRCVRADLLQQATFLRAQERLLTAIPLPASASLEAVEALDQAAQAMQSIIIGIDSNVFFGETALAEAKGNLWQQYLAPYRLALLRLQSTRQRTWMAAAMQDQHLSETAVSCLLEAQNLLQQSDAALTYPLAASLLAAAENQLAVCRNLLQESMQNPVETGSGVLETE